MKTVYLVRHGETVSNAKEVFQEQSISLSEKGMRQADILATRLSKLPVDAIISSDLPRARQTAEKIGTVLHKEPLFVPFFRERKEPTSLQGKSYADPAVKKLRELRDEHIEDASWRYEDEETFFEVRQRAEQCLSLLLKQPEHCIVAVTHGAFMRFLLGIAIFDDAFTPDMWQKMRFGFMTSNTGITVLKHEAKQWTSGWSVLVWNDHAHLG